MWVRLCSLSLIGWWAILLSGCADRPPRATPPPTAESTTSRDESRVAPGVASSPDDQATETPRNVDEAAPAKDGDVAVDDAAPPPQDDRSLTLEEYIQAGMPAHNRVWSGADLARAVTTLAGLAKEDPGNLPRYNSPRSGAAFARITAAENLEQYRNPDLPVAQRLGDALNFLQSTNQLLFLYVNAFNAQGIGAGELIEISSSILRMTAVMFDLTDEFLPTLDKNDPSYPTRMQGLAQMRGGATTTIGGCVTTLTESHAYTTAERKRLIGAMQKTFPDLLPQLPPESLLEIQLRLREMTKDEAHAGLQPELGELADLAEGVKPAASHP